MKFDITLAEFHKVLQKTMPAIPTKSAISILEYLHLSIKEGVLQLIGTDQDITLMTTTEVNEAEDGGVLVPAKKINELIKKLGYNGNLQCTVDDSNFEVQLITSNGKFGIKGLDPDEYLSMPVLFQSSEPDVNNNGNIDTSYPKVFLKKDEIIRLCDKTHFSVSSDEFRPAMSGVFFEFKGEHINAVSTDSFRLSLARIYTQENNFPNDLSVILPSKAVELLRKLDDDTNMSFIETNGKISHVRFDYGNTTLLTKTVDEKFPPYESVLPKDNNIIVNIDKTDLLNAIDKVSIFANNISKQVKFNFEGNELTVSAVDEESGNKGEVKVNCDINEESFEVAFNHKFFQEALENIDDEDTSDNMAVITFLASNKPAMVLPKSDKEEIIMLLMPIRG